MDIKYHYSNAVRVESNAATVAYECVPFAVQECAPCVCFQMGKTITNSGTVRMNPVENAQ